MGSLQDSPHCVRVADKPNVVEQRPWLAHGRRERFADPIHQVGADVVEHGRLSVVASGAAVRGIHENRQDVPTSGFFDGAADPTPTSAGRLPMEDPQHRFCPGLVSTGSTMS